MINKKYLLFSTFFTIFIFAGANLTLALEVKNYPPFFGNSVTDTSNLGQLAVYLFSFGISIAGVIALISFAVGAVMLMISGDDPTLHSNAIDRMKGAILGLMLIISSYLIIHTINPNLESPTLTPITPVSLAPVEIPPGVYFYTQAGCTGQSSPGYVSSTDSIDKSFAGKIQSVKIINSPADNAYYGVIFHRTTGLDHDGQCTLPIINTGDDEQCLSVNTPANTNAADIFTLNKTPEGGGGSVTFYSKSFGELSEQDAGFKSLTSSEIVSPYYIVAADALCYDYTGIDAPPMYEHKCTPSKKCQKDSHTCASPSDCKSGEVCTAGKCAISLSAEKNTCSPNACETFEDCPGSIEITGSYLIALYSEDCWEECSESSSGSCDEDCLSGKGTGKIVNCRTFSPNSEGASNLGTQPIIAPGSDSLNNIYIIPTGS